LNNIHFHYVSDKALAKLKAVVRSLDASDRQKPDEYGGEQHRYVAVSE